MESQSTVSDLQSGPWKRYVTFGGTPRRGQRELWGIVAAPDYHGPHLAVLPPGYGKTLAACGAYAIHRALNRVNKMLILVPTDQQRTQWADGVKANLERCGYKTSSGVGAYPIDKSPRDYRYACDERVEVFIATYQQAYTDPEYWSKLMAMGRWFVVFDECHHLTVEGSWGSVTHALDSSERLYLTATPMRHDKRALIGIPARNNGDGTIEVKPTVYVSIPDAIKEHAIRSILVKRSHYFVNVRMPDDSIKRITTESLIEDGVTDFGDYETKKQLRYCTDYLSSILLDAVTILQRRLLLKVDAHQMLVFAMSCLHAEAVARMLNDLAPEGESNFSDWIGISRSQKENDSVLSAYQSNKLRCLVQVDKAGEGFDNPRSSVLVFLHLIKSATKNIQQIGRGLRRNYDISNFKDDTCQIVASVDSPMLDVALDLEAATNMILRERSQRPGFDDPDQEPRIASIPSVSVISCQFDRAETLSVGTTDTPIDLELAAEGAAYLRSIGVSPDTMEADDLVKIGRDRRVARPHKQDAGAGDLFANESVRIEFEKSRVKQAASLLAKNVISIRSFEEKREFEKAVLVKTIVAIHSEWIKQTGVPHERMTASDLQNKYEWLRKLNASFETVGLPQWLKV